MGTEQETVETGRVRKEARPWSGFFLGLILGLAIAVVLQQAGIWPLDRLLLFGAAGLFALIGILLGGAGRERVGSFSTMLPLVLAVALIGYGATGLGSINENGELNGGCAVDAASDSDTTVVTDTSRRDPFVVDPEGGLSWVATSPGPIMNHFWEIYVDIGGFAVTVADNEEVEPNTAGDLDNTGDVDDVSGYIQDVSNYAGVELAGVFEVGGDIEGEGGACDGFGFVTLEAEPLSTLISQIAAAIEKERQDIDKTFGVKCLHSPADMTKPDDIQRLVDETLANFGTIDILVNNAGTMYSGRFEALTDEGLQTQLDTKLFGFMRAIRAVWPTMRDKNWGRIVNMIGGAGKEPDPYMFGSGMTNSALLNLTKSLSTEFAPHNVLVNAVCPGWVATDLWKRNAGNLQQELGVANEEEARRLAVPVFYTDYAFFARFREPGGGYVAVVAGARETGLRAMAAMVRMMGLVRMRL